jgi:hypothetical protein
MSSSSYYAEGILGSSFNEFSELLLFSLMYRDCGWSLGEELTEWIDSFC